MKNLLKLFKKDYILGLDIGTSSIKYAQFAGRDGGLYLVRSGLVEFARGSREGSEEDIEGALNKVLNSINISKSKVVLVIDCPKTCAKAVTTPYMPREELASAVELTAKNYFPFPVKGSLLDFEILGDFTEDAIRKYSLLVATSPRETVAKYIYFLSKANIRPVAIIPTSLGIQKLMEHSRIKEDEVRAIVDIGQRFTELMIFKGARLLFTRKLPVAGMDFTKAMTGVLVSDRGKTELSMDEAENIKREVGIPPEGQSRIVNDKISTLQILFMVRPLAEQLAGEIDRSFDYYREESGSGKIDSVMLFGGGSALKGLAEFLSSELSLPVKTGDPLDNIKLKSGAIFNKEITNQLAPVVGAALSMGKGLSLVPREIREGRKLFIKRAIMQAIAVGLIFASALLYIGMRIKISSLNKRIVVAKLEFSSLGNQLVLAETQHLANTRLANEPYWDDIFKELSNIIPDRIFLTQVNMSDQLISMRGVVSSETRQQILSNFILILEEGIFKDVKLVTTKEISDDSNMFELKCWID